MVTLAAPAGADTVAGTVTAGLLLDRAIVSAAEGAADKVTMQLELPPGEMVPGLHVIPVTLIGAPCPAETFPPVAVTGIPAAAGDAPIGFVTATEALVKLAVVVTEATATTPFEMVLAFMPAARHIYVPLPGLQITDLPAAVAAGPAVTVIP